MLTANALAYRSPISEISQPIVEPYISPNQGIKTVDITSTLGQALAGVESGHEPVFVYNRNEFVGLVAINTLSSLSRYQDNTPVRSCMMKPYRITKNTLLFDVLEFMYGSLLYTLPVFSKEGSIEALVRFRDVVKRIIEWDGLFDDIVDNLKPKPVITTSENSSAAVILRKMRDNDRSRIVLVDGKENLKGLISRRDFRDLMIRPTPRQRYRKKEMVIPYNALITEKQQKRIDYPIKVMVTRRVLKDNVAKSYAPAVKRLIDSDKNSIVLVDINKPVGIISMRDVLKALLAGKPTPEFNIRISKPSDNVPRFEIAYSTMLLERFCEKQNKRMPIRDASVSYEEPKTPVGDTVLFNSTFLLNLKKGKQLIATSSERDFITNTRDLLRIMDKQLRRKVSNGYANREARH